MLGLKFLSGRKTSVPIEDQSATKTTSEAAEWRHLHQRLQISFGRHLAFAVEEDSIQMAATLHYGSKLRLLDVRKTYYTQAVRSETDRPTFFQSAIEEYIRAFGGRKPVISVCLTGPETAFRTIMLPKMPARDLAGAVEFESKKQLPFPITDCEFDYRPIEKLIGGSDKRLKIAVIAATKPAIKQALQPFDNLGLEVAHVYHSQDVLGRLLRQLPRFNSKENYALINIQRQRTEISYYRGSDLVFQHISAVGSSFLANRSDPTIYEYFAESLATEFQNSLDYYSGQYSSIFSNEVFIYGDLAYTADLIDLLADRFGFSFARFPAEDLQCFSGSESTFEGSLAVCLSAVAGSINRARLANLLPPSIKVIRRNRTTNKLGISALVGLTVVLVGLWLTSLVSLKDIQENLDNLNQQIADFKVTKEYTTYNLLKRKVAGDREFIDKASREPSYLSLNLKELSRITPSAVRLYNVNIATKSVENNMLIAGVITTRSTPPELILAEFVENMTASPFYEKVTIERHVKKEVRGGFELDFNLSMKGVI